MVDYPLVRLARLQKTCQTLKHLPVGRSKHFSFLARKKAIIAVGWNKSRTTHPLAKKYGHRFSCIHSELDVLLNFPYPLKELYRYDLINVRINSVDSLVMSFPCVWCRKMLSDFGINKVYYTNNNGQFEVCYL